MSDALPGAEMSDLEVVRRAKRVFVENGILTDDIDCLIRDLEWRTGAATIVGCDGCGAETIADGVVSEQEWWTADEILCPECRAVGGTSGIEPSMEAKS
jgi:hypothetical protein